MKKIIVDFDSTIHVRGCDIDDAFALFFLLKKEDVEIPLVTTSFGNSNEDRIYESTTKMFRDLSIDIPLKKGGDLLLRSGGIDKRARGPLRRLEYIEFGSHDEYDEGPYSGDGSREVELLCRHGRDHRSP